MRCSKSCRAIRGKIEPKSTGWFGENHGKNHGYWCFSRPPIGENSTKTHGKQMTAIDIQFLNQLQKDTKGSCLSIINNALYPTTIFVESFSVVIYCDNQSSFPNKILKLGIT